MATADSRLVYSVPGVGCEHCQAAISSSVGQVPGVVDVAVDLDSKRVTVRGVALDDDAVRAAVVEAGYEVAP